MCVCATDIRFSQEEMQLLKYGLNCSIENPVSTYSTSLIAETERTIMLLYTKYIPQHGSIKLKQVVGSSGRSDVLQNRQLYVVKELNKRLATENTIIAKADKGKIIDATTRCGFF